MHDNNEKSNRPDRAGERGPQAQSRAGLMNAQVFSNWHDRHRDRLLNSMTAVTRSRQAAEDVTAAALGAAFQNLHRFRGKSSFYTWVYAIALNEVRRCLRRNHATRLESIDRPDANELREPDMVADALERSEGSAKLRKALHQVPAMYRRTLVDHFVRGYSVKRIARRHGVPVGTVLSRIFKGKRILREAWEAR